MRRRTLLAGAVAAPLVLGLGMRGFVAAQGLPALTLYDARLQPAERAAQAIGLRGGNTRQTDGEIAGLLLRERLFAGGGTILGITGHSEFLLAEEVARLVGRRVVPLQQTGAKRRWLGGVGEAHWQPLLAELLDGEGSRSVASPTVFAWIAA